MTSRFSRRTSFPVCNDKGSSRIRDARSEQPCLQQLLELRLGRREFTAMAATAVVLPASMAACSRAPAVSVKPPALPFKEVPFSETAEDVLAEGHTRQILISWGDPMSPGVPEFKPDEVSAERAGQQFGYNNDFIAWLPIAAERPEQSDHGLLVINHEYPLPWLMWSDLDESTAAAAMSKGQVDASMAAIGMSVLEVRRENDSWNVVIDSPKNRRISMFSEIDIRGPARGHPRMRTREDPEGTTVIGTHDNCNGGTTPWGTVLSGEEGSSDFFKGDFEKSPDREHLERYYYDLRSETGDYGWGRFHPRFDFEQELNEPNRFEWVVEIDPYDPDSRPVKRTALGRFAHEGAHAVLNHDGRTVVFMGDDWEFEYIYRFVTTESYDADNRAANRHLLDEGTLSVARFSDDGTLRWLPLRFGEGPLTAANGFSDQGDVLIQTRRAADLLGATPMDAPEGFVSDPRTGVLYLALTQNRDRAEHQVNGPNPRADNEFGHLLELFAPSLGDGQHDYAAAGFSWSVMLLCGERDEQAPFHPDTVAESRFTDPDNLSVDPQGRLWVCTDIGNGMRDALYVLATEGTERNLSRRFYLPPLQSECCSPAFTPDGCTLFLAVQHPGEEAQSVARAVTNWPSEEPGQPPRPSVIVITRDDGGVVGGEMEA